MKVPYRMIWILAVLMVLMGLGTSFSKTEETRSIPKGETTRTLEVQGKERSYLLYVPKNIDVKKPVPLILAFHGGSSTPKQFAKVTQLMDKGADRAGYVVAFPAGYKNFWHAGDDCCGPPYEEGLDDVAFVRAVLDDIHSLLPVDPARIFATGFSNGGNMTYRLACELSDRIAAVAINGSSLSLSKCNPKRPVPILHFHGTDDTFHPYSGGKGVTEFNYFKLGAPETIKQWVKWNGCTDETVTSYQKGAATCETHPKCKQNAEVTFCTIKGMGHQWPGFTVKFPIRLARQLGPGSDDLSATEMLLAFFQKHPMPETP